MAKARVREDSKTDEFRAVLSTLSLESGLSLAGLLHSALEVPGRVGPTLVDSKAFCNGLISLKQVRSKFTPSDLQDIFNDADEGEKSKVPVEELIDFFQRTISKARALALKLRAAVMKENKSEADYRALFSTISSGSSSVSDREKFTQFAEDMLQVVINDNDAIGLYSLYDMDGDGKVSAADFVGFILGLTADAVNALDSGNGDVIVDIKISSSPKEDSELLRNGYAQVTPDLASLAAQGLSLETHGTFGKGQSMWMWRRKQGTCSGRLRPVIDVQLNNQSHSSALVQAGYLCVSGTISGLHVWVKRAITDEEDQDGIVDLYVTLGKTAKGGLFGSSSKGGFSSVGAGGSGSPGVGWVRVEGNFARSINPLNHSEACLWVLPQRTRSLDRAISPSMHAGLAVSEERRLADLLLAVRRAIRHFVPVSEMRRVAKISFEAEASAAGSNNLIGSSSSGSSSSGGREGVMNKAFLRSDRMFDFAAMVHNYDSSGHGQMKKSHFTKLLYDAGACIDSADVRSIFRYFDFNLNGSVSREEYCQVVGLTEAELAQVIEKVRAKLLSTCKPSSSSGSGNSSSKDAAGTEAAKVAKTKAAVRTNRVLGEVFRLVNSNDDGIISLDEVLDLTGKLEIFVNEGEAARIFRAMDVNSDGRVEEADFVSFMKRNSELAVRTAQQVTSSANEIRAWVRQGSVSSSSAGSGGAAPDLARPWAELKRRHEKATGAKFPEYIGPDDLMTLVSSLSRRTQLSPQGARQLALLVAPDKCGRIQQSDLGSFLARPVRSFGELVALLERDVMKPVFDAYKACRASTHDGVPNQSLHDAYTDLVHDTIMEVQGTTAVQSLSSASSALDVVAVSQLKAGIEAAMSRLKQFEGTVPNVEEWASLCCLVGAVATDDDSYGVNPRIFVDGICSYACGGIGDASSSAASASLDVVCKELQRLIRDEAMSAGKWQRADYKAAFGLFDTDGSGAVSVEEFRLMLVRLQLMDLVPENQLPALMARFDSRRKGTITYEDFIAFVDKHKNLATEQGTNDSLDASDPLDLATAPKPPFAITRNADCDLLAWVLWKNCCAAEPSDPESVVVELEAACHESELTVHSGTVSVKELWNLLFELRLQGSMSKVVFERGVRFLVSSATDRARAAESSAPQDQSLVDYSTLCRYVIRTGRAHKTMVEERAQADEKKYKTLRAALRRELSLLAATDASSSDSASSQLDASSSSSSSSQGRARRFDKIFRRLDSDGDGKISAQEFKVGLKRLGVRDEKEWNVRIIRLLFRDLDADNDGFLSLAELGNLAVDPSDGGAGRSRARAGRGSDWFDKDGEGNEDGQAQAQGDEDEVFGQSRIVSDALLFAKVYEALRERVPPAAGADHCEAVKEAVRKFFSRYDPDKRGSVSEERFRAFLRRSGLQERLPAAELRRLIEALRRKAGAAEGSGLGAGAGTGAGQVVMDYEALCLRLTKAATEGPQSRAEIILRRLQEASQSSAASGRPFLSLCALVDTKFRGRITREELLLTCKMMTCPLSMVELEALRDLLPSHAYTADGTVDYKELNVLLTQGSPRPSTLMDMGPRGFSAAATERGAHASFRTPADHLAFGATGPFGRTSVQASFAAAGPAAAAAAGGVQGLGQGLPVAVGNYEVLSVCDKIRRCPGGSAALRRSLELQDHRGLGVTTARQLLAALEDELGVGLVAAEGMALIQAFGRAGEDAVDYDALCEAVDSAPARGLGAGAGAARGAVYVTPRVLQRLRELKEDGRHPRDIFEGYDLDNTGMVDKWRFQEVVQRLGLLSSRAQLEAALDDFAALAGPDLVCFEDFCAVLEAEARAGERGGVRASSSSTLRDREPERERDRDVRESRRGRTEREREREEEEDSGRWYSREASPKPRRGFGEPYESLRAFRAGVSLDPGSDGPGLFPPKVDDSLSFSRQLPLPPRDRDRYGSSRGRDSFDRERESGSQSVRGSFDREVLHRSGRSSPMPPRVSPSKMGSKMWGNTTSLEEKGRPPRVDGGWCCAVCLYTENSSAAAKCAICDSANYTRRKDFVVKEQCRNCTFLNGQLSSECEMCGVALFNR